MKYEMDENGLFKEDYDCVPMTHSIKTILRALLFNNLYYGLNEIKEEVRWNIAPAREAPLFEIKNFHIRYMFIRNLIGHNLISSPKEFCIQMAVGSIPPVGYYVTQKGARLLAYYGMFITAEDTTTLRRDRGGPDVQRYLKRVYANK